MNGENAFAGQAGSAPDSTKLYQIKEDDLATLESELPRLLDAAAMTCNDAITRKRWQAVKEILSNVRWDYGPPQQVEKID